MFWGFIGCWCWLLSLVGLLALVILSIEIVSVACMSCITSHLLTTQLVEPKIFPTMFVSKSSVIILNAALIEACASTKDKKHHVVSMVLSVA